MTWTDFYLLCFFLGTGLSFLALIAGVSHLHLPHLHVHHGFHIPHGQGAAQLPWFNFGTVAAFLAWFGGTGYLLESHYHVWIVIVMIVALLSGFGASAIVFLFLAKILMARETQLDAADYDMVGVLGRLSIPIRQGGGTGELIYSQQGTRRVAGARSEDGVAIPKGAEVMVTRYEKGIAYVRPWIDPADALDMRVQ